jgi:hypothetical protein
VIVARGLGIGGAGAIVAAGLGLALQIVVLPPETLITPLAYFTPKRYKELVKESVTVQVPAVVVKGLLADISAKGAGKISLVKLLSDAEVQFSPPTGAATALVVGVSAASELGAFIANGAHDMEDEDILAMLLAML